MKPGYACSQAISINFFDKCTIIASIELGIPALLSLDAIHTEMTEEEKSLSVIMEIKPDILMAVHINFKASRERD